MNLNYIKDRLQEPSSWRGLAAIAAAFGLIITPDQVAAIAAAWAAVTGAIGAFSPDKK